MIDSGRIFPQKLGFMPGYKHIKQIYPHEYTHFILALLNYTKVRRQSFFKSTNQSQDKKDIG